MCVNNGYKLLSPLKGLTVGRLSHVARKRSHDQYATSLTVDLLPGKAKESPDCSLQWIEWHRIDSLPYLFWSWSILALCTSCSCHWEELWWTCLFDRRKAMMALDFVGAFVTFGCMIALETNSHVLSYISAAL